jgi:hypothetical protein
MKGVMLLRDIVSTYVNVTMYPLVRVYYAKKNSHPDPVTLAEQSVSYSRVLLTHNPTARGK